MRRSALIVVSTLLALAPGVARANSGPRIGANVEYGFGLDGAMASGLGVGVDLGYSIGFAIVRLIPEAEFTYYTAGQLAAPKVGGAVFVGKGLEIGAYMHLVVPFAPTLSKGAIGFDSGLALDVTAIPKVDLGVHFGGQWIGDTDEAIESPDEALIGGVHAGVRF